MLQHRKILETAVDRFSQAPAAPSDDLLQLQGNPFANMMNGEQCSCNASEQNRVVDTADIITLYYLC